VIPAHPCPEATNARVLLKRPRVRVDSEQVTVPPGLLLAAILLALGVGSFAGWRIRRLRAQLAHARTLSRVEEVTSLRSREAFIEDLELELMRVARSGRPASLVVLSVNGGPVEGAALDRHRRQLAQTIRATVRTVDTAYRIGSDEFALILSDTRARGAMVAAGRIEEELLAAGTPDGSLTAGVAEAGPGLDRHELFRNAYCAYLAAGRAGRSTVLAYSPELELGDDEVSPVSEIRGVEGSTA